MTSPAPFTDRTLGSLAAAAASDWRSPWARQSRVQTSSFWRKRPNPTPSRPGTVHTAVADVEAAGRKGRRGRRRRAQGRGCTARGGCGGRALRRHRHRHQQRQRHLHRTDRGTGRQEVRPDDGHQRPRHVPPYHGGAAPPAKVPERTRHHAGAPAEHEPPLAGCTSVLHLSKYE